MISEYTEKNYMWLQMVYDNFREKIGDNAANSGENYEIKDDMEKNEFISKGSAIMPSCLYEGSKKLAYVIKPLFELNREQLELLSEVPPNYKLTGRQAKYFATQLAYKGITQLGGRAAKNYLF